MPGFRSVLGEMLGSFGPDKFGISPAAYEDLARSGEQWREDLAVSEGPIEPPDPGLGL